MDEPALHDATLGAAERVEHQEGRLVEVDASDPLSHKKLVEDEAVRIVRRRGDLIITETRHGFICANSGVDLSNVERGFAAPRALVEAFLAREDGASP